MKVGQCKVQSGAGSDKERGKDRRVVVEFLRAKISISAMVLVVSVKCGFSESRPRSEFGQDTSHHFLSCDIGGGLQTHWKGPSLRGGISPVQSSSSLNAVAGGVGKDSAGLVTRKLRRAVFSSCAWAYS